jgi:hypothetical protein
VNGESCGLKCDQERETTAVLVTNLGQDLEGIYLAVKRQTATIEIVSWPEARENGRPAYA